MSDNKAPQIKYHVFVSFRGEIRFEFLSHLTEAFEKNHIKYFVDDKIDRGEEIGPFLDGAIGESFISLIMFSQGYASSPWCLQELVTILECKEKYGRIVIPVFYKVQPSDVGHQSSESFKKAFAKHETNYEPAKVKNWRHALKITSKISGITSLTFPIDSDLLKAIVDLVLTKLVKPRVNSKGLVETAGKIADVESRIRKESKETLLIGIWGMGGVGKTILAQEVFNKLCSEYEGCYFLLNEREESRRVGIISLRREMFSELLGNAVKIISPNSLSDDRICEKKVLICLDDVNDSDHVEKLLGTLDNFGSGSRIIITTRDKQVLTANKVDEIYQLGEFNYDKAFELFSLNAFNQSDHQKKMEYHDLSKSMVHYAKGVPLILKVLSHQLCGKIKEVWESELDKLKNMPPTKVFDVMKLSYDDLDRKEQHIFLDLACFFLTLLRKVNVDDLKSLLKDGEMDNSVVVMLERLKDKAITFAEDNTISMHDSLQEMAWEIVRQESTEDPGSRSRLWDPNDIYEALKNEKVTGAIRSIRIHLPTLKGQKLMPHIFADMNRLKFLEISGYDNWDCYNHLILAAEEGLQFLTTELRFLCWNYYPLKSLPNSFSVEKLVMLKLPDGRMEKLWDGVKNLVSLKELDASESHMLKELPDLSKARNIETLILRGCSMLRSVHPSILSLPKLDKLDLSFCTSLTILTSDSHLCRLSDLSLSGCENLREFSVISEKMEELSLENTKIKTLPLSSEPESKLKLLHLRQSAIEHLPSSIINLTQLPHLDVSCCRELQLIPKLPMFLKTLDAKDCRSLKTVLFPSTAVEQLMENRTHVLLWNCLNLDEHSLVGVELNAQINLMKFANHQLSTTNEDYGSCQGVYMYPGSSVPEWLEYKETKNYIIIDLSSTPTPPILGFIFCFILGKYQGTQRIKGLEFNISISDGEGKMDGVRLFIDYWIGRIETDHVCVIYDQRCSSFLNSRARNQTRFKIEVAMEAKFSSKESLPREVLKGFGLSLISSSTYNTFSEQMELRDHSMYHFQ